jgi:uncharacterized protein
MEAILAIVITTILFYFFMREGKSSTSKKGNNINYIVPSKKIPSEEDGIVRAICINNYDNWCKKKHKNLKIGKQYTIEYAIIGSSTSLVYLSELKEHLFSYSLFNCYINRQEIGLIEDSRIFWDVSQQDMSTRSVRILQYHGATKEGLEYIRVFFPNVPVIDRSNMDNTPTLPPIPDIKDIKQFAVNGWELGDIHGLPHWQKVERNGILLSLIERNGKLCFREGVNIKVVCIFAYLHDKCRLNNNADLKHGERTADMLHTIRDTLLKDLDNEEFSLLEQACKLHTTTHKTGNPTIDTCFDADRLDLKRVGIEPCPDKMATSFGEFYAMNTLRFMELDMNIPPIDSFAS